MRKKVSVRFQLLYLILSAIALIAPATAAHADNIEMQHKYDEIKIALQNNVYGIPVYIQSSDADQTTLGEVYGIVPHPYDDVRTALATPETWCDIAPLHLNIKACTYQHIDNNDIITFYAGRKYYEKADDVYQLSYHFQLSQTESNYFQVKLLAKDGSMGTSDYHISVEAIPLDDSRTFIHFRYSYHYNFLTSMGMNTYLATIGRNKVGFSVASKDKNGKPTYVGGVRGIIERNTIRYYFAIESYLDTIQMRPEKRFDARLNKWFNLTEKYPLQLHEMSRQDYLQYKEKEHLDQLRLQQALIKTDN
jgi:hypothetical protein